MRKIGLIAAGTFVLGVGSSEAIKFAAGNQQTVTAREVGCHVNGVCQVAFDVIKEGKKIGEQVFSLDQRAGTLRNTQGQKLSGDPPFILLKLAEDLKLGKFDGLLDMKP